MKGAFITIYGVNNLGKTTHVNILADRLRGMGFEVKTLKYPVYDIEPTGSFINSVLRSGVQKISEEELQMWYVLNRYQYQAELKALLDAGVFVIAEDYSGTGIAWGMAKGLDEDWICGLNEKLIHPDLAVLFEGARQMQAKEKIHIHEQNDDLAEKCKSVHSYLADKFGWQRVEVEEEKDDTAAGLWAVVEDFMIDAGILDNVGFGCKNACKCAGAVGQGSGCSCSERSRGSERFSEREARRLEDLESVADEVFGV